MAFKIKVPEFVIDRSIQTCETTNYGMRGDGSDGTTEQQIVGVIGQNMINLALGKPFMEPSTEHDGGVDFVIFGLRCDVKTMGRTVTPTKEYVNNLMESQVKFDVDCYLFTSFNRVENELTVCGWLPKSMLDERAEHFIKGDLRTRNDGTQFQAKANYYEIKNSMLFHQAKNFPELFVEFYLYAG